jgi:Protein of unknown function (DUF3433)
LDSAGTWTGKRCESGFILSAEAGRPPQGLVSTYYDERASGVYSPKNFTKRFGALAYWAINSTPILVVVIYGHIWRVLLDEIKRIDKYCRMFNKGGCKARSLLCLNYHSFWTPLGILPAIRYRHWTVALSSTDFVLASTVIPVVQNYTFVWELYSGGSLSWPDSYSWQVAIADPSWSRVLVYLLSFTLLCSCGLLILLPRQKTGLTRNPSGIASMHELVLTKDHLSLRLGENADKGNFSYLCSQTGSIWFRLRRQPNMCHMTLETFDAPTPPSRFLDALKDWVPFIGTIQKQWSKSTPTWSCQRSLSTQSGTASSTVPNFFCSREQSSLCGFSLKALLFFGIFIVTIMNRNAEAQQWNHAIPLSLDIYPIVGVFVQVRHLPLTAMGTKYSLQLLCLVSTLD